MLLNLSYKIERLYETISVAYLTQSTMSNYSNNSESLYLTNEDIPPPSILIRILVPIVGLALIFLHHVNHKYIRDVIRY